ncbi:hypothetical protein [Mycobacterium asiaticum]|uniref:Glycosyltransferase RgtA/B/C/D-like domain-containing protein n=1 Tax=Mycobacterium asiaticum TaxID=1790 RepID=A0A1A3N8X9_MYCAS|nr:hypothetical protein [Mycobacterium asiaticum]OBK18246.1 hypothetical protein A5636_21445 [Mycobacterium asiaticum]
MRIESEQLLTLAAPSETTAPEPAHQTPAPVRRTRARLSDAATALLLAVSWQALLTLIGALLSSDRSGIFDHTMQWDAQWYLNILNERYQINPASAAFYPLFPLIVGTGSALTLHSIPYPLLGLLVNTVALALAIAALLTISREFKLREFRYVTVALFLAAPAAVFLHLFYTEAVFVAVGFWAYAFALQRRWAFMAVALALLTATRLPAFLFVGLCGLEYFRAYEWNVKKAVNRNLGYFLLAPAGFLLYGCYLLAVRGDFFGMFTAYKSTKAWGYLSFDPNFAYSIFRSARETVLAVAGRRPIDNDIVVNYAIPLLCLALLLSCSVYLLCAYRGKGVPLGIFGLCSLVFFTLNSSFVAVHRYALPCLCIYIALALIYADHRRGKALILGTGLAMLFAQVVLVHLLFVTRDFAG